MTPRDRMLAAVFTIDDAAGRPSGEVDWRAVARTVRSILTSTDHEGAASEVVRFMRWYPERLALIEREVPS